MRVGVDAHMVGERETGNETYALGLLHGLDKIGFPVDAYAFGPLPPSVHRQHRILPHLSAPRIALTTPLLALRDGLDLYHATTYVLPPLLPCPAVVTIHDISYALHPEWFAPRVRLMLTALVPKALRKACLVIAVSEHTKNDIVSYYGTAPEKVVVTPLAPRPTSTSKTPRIPATPPFFLLVGNIEPRKNVEAVLRALALLRERGTLVRLVIAGSPGHHHQRVARTIAQLGLVELVQFMGYVTDHELSRLYASCIAVVHPAHYEGFGLTPLEAMAHGAPVLASNTSSVPGVVGDAAILLEPCDVGAWADSMDRVLRDDELRQALSANGLARAESFSWERCARETVAVYKSVLGERSLS